MSGSKLLVIGSIRHLTSRSLRSSGFTLLELLVTLAVIATLVSIVTPRYWKSVDRAQEVVLKENLRAVRTAIDQYFTDHGKYPDTLADLVSRRYLRSVPKDPIIDAADQWIIVPPPTDQNGDVYDIRSSAPGVTSSGSSYGSL